MTELLQLDARTGTSRAGGPTWLPKIGELVRDATADFWPGQVIDWNPCPEPPCTSPWVMLRAIRDRRQWRVSLLDVRPIHPLPGDWCLVGCETDQVGDGLCPEHSARRQSGDPDWDLPPDTDKSTTSADRAATDPDRPNASPHRSDNRDHPVLDPRAVAAVHADARLASTLRGGFPATHPARLAARRLATELDRLHKQGHTVQQLAEAVGLSEQALRRRLREHRARADNQNTDQSQVVATDRESGTTDGLDG